jgi:hypothetical protein
MSLSMRVATTFITDKALLPPIPVAAQPKVWIIGRSLDGIAGLNPAAGMDISLL